MQMSKIFKWLCSSDHQKTKTTPFPIGDMFAYGLQAKMAGWSWDTQCISPQT